MGLTGIEVDECDLSRRCEQPGDAADIAQLNLIVPVYLRQRGSVLLANGLELLDLLVELVVETQQNQDEEARAEEDHKQEDIQQPLDEPLLGHRTPKSLKATLVTRAPTTELVMKPTTASLVAAVACWIC